MPVAVVFAASAIAMVIVSLMTKPPEGDTLRKFFVTPSQAESSGASSRSF